MGVDLRGGECISRGDVGEADESVHQRQLSGMIQFQTRNAFAVRQDGGLGQFAQLAAIEKGLKDVLLHVVIVVDHGRHLLANEGEGFPRLSYSRSR